MNLFDFCSKSPNKKDLHTPWREGDAVIASDSWIMVVFDSLDGEYREPSKGIAGRDKGLLKYVGQTFSDATIWHRVSGLSIPKDEPCGCRGKKGCPSCEYSRIRIDTIFMDGIAFRARHLNLIRANLPDAEIRVNDNKGIAMFRFNGGHGFLSNAASVCGANISGQ